MELAAKYFRDFLIRRRASGSTSGRVVGRGSVPMGRLSGLVCRLGRVVGRGAVPMAMGRLTGSPVCRLGRAVGDVKNTTFDGRRGSVPMPMPMEGWNLGWGRNATLRGFSFITMGVLDGQVVARDDGWRSKTVLGGS